MLVCTQYTGKYIKYSQKALTFEESENYNNIGIQSVNIYVTITGTEKAIIESVYFHSKTMHILNDQYDTVIHV